jgi:hypothetical protein
MAGEIADEGHREVCWLGGSRRAGTVIPCKKTEEPDYALYTVENERAPRGSRMNRDLPDPERYLSTLEWHEDPPPP